MRRKNTSRLDKYKYSSLSGFDHILLKQSYGLLKRSFYGKTCIELGSADGAGTNFLVSHFKRVVAVDGSKRMLKNLKKNIRSKNLEIVHSYIEDLNTDNKFDTIILGHILEHVDDPVVILKKAKSLAHKKSRILITSPNAMSVHRQAGVLMGMIKNEYSLSERDHLLGHKRIYDLGKLKNDIDRSGLKIIKIGGDFLKPFSNSMMEKVFNNSTKMAEAYREIGERYPEIASEIYAICKI